MAGKKLPKATRPDMPGYGLAKNKKGLLRWKWAEDRLKKSRQYWIATTRPDGAPHVMPVWGLWLNNEFWFSTGKTSRKARNLAQSPRCVICSSDSEEAVIVEGLAKVVHDPAQLRPVYSAYKKKYKMDISGMEEPLFRALPRTVFGLFEKKFAATATRWTFAD